MNDAALIISAALLIAVELVLVSIVWSMRPELGLVVALMLPSPGLVQAFSYAITDG